MGSVFGRILGRTPAAGSSGTAVNVRRPKEPPTETAASLDPSLHQPDKDLLNKLRGVYVESTANTVTQENPYGSERTSKLPQDRTSYDDEDLFQVTNVTEGYLTAQQVLDIFDKRGGAVGGQSEWTEEKVSAHYKISKDNATNLLKYFGSYRVAGKLDKGDPEMKLHPFHR